MSLSSAARRGSGHVGGLPQCKKAYLMMAERAETDRVSPGAAEQGDRPQPAVWQQLQF
jgi:hypothetical protein